MDQDNFFDLLQEFDIKQEKTDFSEKKMSKITEKGEKYLKQLERKRIAARIKRQNETPEQREKRLLRDALGKQKRRNNETQEQREERLQRERERERIQKRNRRMNETPEQRKERLLRNALGKSEYSRVSKLRAKGRKANLDEPAIVDLKLCRFCMTSLEGQVSYDIPKRYCHLHKSYFGEEVRSLTEF